MPPSEESQRGYFEQQFGQMAYQAFSSKFPDLMHDVVTFKVLDVDMTKSSGVGAFILEKNGEFVYIPAVISDNMLKPFDLMYVKSKDIFLPLSSQWMEEIAKSTISNMGEGTKLPETVATDVDIRNLVVPPTTGRYSYASVSPRARLEAAASEPLGRKLTKLASGNDGMPNIGGSGSVTEPDYNPEIWSTFIEQFGRIQNSTPGQALDNGTMDLETLAKMYKSHQKTWEMTHNPALAQGQAQGQAQGGMSGMAPQGTQAVPGSQASMSGQPVGTGGAVGIQGAAPGMGAMPKMAAVRPAPKAPADVAKVIAQLIDSGHIPKSTTVGGHLDNLFSTMGYGATGGALTGAAHAASDDNYADVPGAALRGGLYGALGAPIGGAIGHGAVGPQGYVTPRTGELIGQAVGSIGGGYLGARSSPTVISDLVTPGDVAMQAYYMQNAPINQSFGQRYASVRETPEAGLKAMLKHAAKRVEHKPKLLEFLTRAPGEVKTAFARVLNKNPRLLKKAADIYGKEPLLAALQPNTQKTAGGVPMRTGGALYIIDADTPAKEITTSFGSDAPEAFNGVLLRGYYFKDTRPKLKLAVQVQEYHDFHDAREPGIYRIYNLKGEPKPALVLAEAFDFDREARNTFPRDSGKVKRVKTRVQNNQNEREPGDLDLYQIADPGPDVERSHVTHRCVIFPNGDYMCSDKVLGEMVTEATLPKGPLYDRIMRDSAAKPAKGKGCFVSKSGRRYTGSKPCEIKEISYGSDGVARGKIGDVNGWSTVNFVIDPRSPINRPMRMRDTDLVVIPASWKWVPLKEQVESSDFLMNPKALQMVVMDALGSMGASEIVARRAGESMYAVNGSRTLDKKTALHKIAADFDVHASAAEAMLKIAEHTGVCRAFTVTPWQYAGMNYTMKVAQGEAAPMTPMGGPPAMQQAPQMAQAAPAAPAAPSAVEQAFTEVTQGMQQQISQLQSNLDILMTVQQRAMELSGQAPAPTDPATQGQAPAGPPAPADPAMQSQAPAQQGMPQQGMPQQGMPQQGMPADPSMQGMPPGMSPEMGSDPSAAAMDPAMAQQGQGQQPPAVMSTESPSASEIAAQVNPNFLNNAGTFNDAGAFDAGAIASLSQKPDLRALGSQYAANLEDSIDDLGRTLLTLYMQENDLKEQLGDESFTELETQLRDSFKNLGDLVLTLTHNTGMLSQSAA
jgi:hypothetical protein